MRSEPEPNTNTKHEPTEAEVIGAFSDTTPTEAEIEHAFTGEPESTPASADSDDFAATKKKNLHDVLFSAATAILISIIGGAMYSLLTFGNLSGVISLFSGETEAKIISIAPTELENGILKNDSHLIIKTENASIEKLKNILVLDPAIDYDLKETKPGTEYELTPTSALADNTVFNLNSVSGSVFAYKWAFQTKKALSVSKIYPANGASYVSENSAIEFNFSYPDVSGVEEHFQISPSVSGSFAKTARGWRFSPSSPLAANTTYEITITSGLTYGEETMQEDFHSSFSTFARAVSSSDARDRYITLDKISTFHESDTPVLVVNQSEYNSAERISVEKLYSADDFIRHLKGENVSGESLGDKTFRKLESSNYTKTIVLDDTLPTGYYILRIKSADGANLLTASVQVNNLNAYAFESERDLIFWVAEGESLKSGAKINFKNHDYYTDGDGLLRLENFSDFSADLDYAKIGEDDQPLIIGLSNFKNDLYPSGFVYTDRPLYKPTDTIKIWGYAPLQFFADAPDLSKFSLTLTSYQSGETITLFKHSVTLNSDGTFSVELNLDNFKDLSYGGLNLVYNDSVIASRYITIEDYTLENYTYEFITSKNYVLSGEDYVFSVKVSHVTGFPAANKDLVVTYNKHDYYSTTNSYGEATFTLPTDATLSSPSASYILDSRSIEVNSAGAEYNKYSTYSTVYILRSNLSISATQDATQKTLDFTAKNLDVSRDINIVWGNYNLLASSSYSGPATITVYEHKTTRTITGYYYNNYTKENTPNYHYTTTDSAISSSAITFENGKFSYSYSEDYQPSTEDTYYSYSVQISTTDSLGRPAYSSDTYYHRGSFLGSDGYGAYGSNSAVLSHYDWTNALNDAGLSSEYYYYRFGFRNVNGSSHYNLNDAFSLGLYDASGESVENTGSVLAIGYKERIVSASVSNNNTFDFSFDYNLYPGAKFVGAYFKDGRFYRIAPSYYDYDDANATLTVAIETDKTSYAPGDHVKAKLTITYPDGSRAGSGKVNLSVVNDAVFNAGEDSANLLSSIYANKAYKGYSMSTYRDYELTTGGGLGAGGDGGRSNFGDTIFFGEKSFENGEVEFEFDLNDSITSFRLTALAIRPADVIAAGVGTQKISSFLPLSISTISPKKVKSTDDLVLNATALVAGSDAIHYTFEIKDTSLYLEASGARGETVYGNLGKLSVGDYTARIAARDDSGNEDAMEFPITILETAQEVAIKQTLSLAETKTLTPAKNPIIVEFYSGEAKKYLDYLDKIERNLTERLDTQIAYYKAQALRTKLYQETGLTKAPDFSAYLTDAGALKPLANASGDYILTALANCYAADYFDLSATSFQVEIGDDTTTALEKYLVLASFREPILLELNALNSADLNSIERTLLGLSYALLGDYDSAKAQYQAITYSADNADLYALLSTMVDKTNATALIDQASADAPSSDYLYFAFISFFNNNEASLVKQETIDIARSEGTEHLTLNGLTVAKRVYSSADLATLNFRVGSADLYATYYYQGRISEATDVASDLAIRLEGSANLGSTVDLVVNISALQGENRNGELNVALPTGLKFSATFSGSDGLYLVRNNNEYVKLSLNQKYHGNEIHIPLYVATPGNFELEPVIFIHDGTYHLSNNLNITLNK